MGMRFRKSVSLGKGARINISKSGIGASVGPRGARYSAHSSGRKTTSVGIPSSGLHYVSSKGAGGSSRNRTTSASQGLTQAQLRRLTERHEKKNQLIEERRSKPLHKLKELYASGKISKANYEDLAKRDKEITKDLVVFGKGAGVKLAERYISGKINTSEFINLKKELIFEPENEKEEILNGYRETIKNVSDFVEKARANRSGLKCNYCGKPKKFLSPLFSESDFKLCRSCRKQYNSLCQYSGINGQYFSADPAKIDPDTQNTLSINVVSEHIFNYR